MSYNLQMYSGYYIKSNKFYKPNSCLAFSFWGLSNDYGGLCPQPGAALLPLKDQTYNTHLWLPLSLLHTTTPVVIPALIPPFLPTQLIPLQFPTLPHQGITSAIEASASRQLSSRSDANERDMPFVARSHRNEQPDELEKGGGAHPSKYAPRNNNNKSWFMNNSKHELVEQMLMRTSPPTVCVEAVVFWQGGPNMT